MLNKIKYWVTWPIYKVLPNPSQQDQIQEHLCPRLTLTFLLVYFVPYGAFVGLLAVLLSLYEELIQDKHYKDLFMNSEGGQDGRVDMFFKLLGSGLVYLPLLWRG